jgi:hypothetical protein
MLGCSTTPLLIRFLQAKFLHVYIVRDVIPFLTPFWCLIHISWASLEIFFWAWGATWDESLTTMSQLLFFACVTCSGIWEWQGRVKVLENKRLSSLILWKCSLNVLLWPFVFPSSQVQMEQFFSPTSYGCLLST